MHTTSPLSRNVRQRALNLVDDMSAFVADIRAALEHRDPEAEPTAEDWRTLDIQMCAVPDLQRGLAALARAAIPPSTSSAHLIERPDRLVLGRGRLLEVAESH